MTKINKFGEITRDYAPVAEASAEDKLLAEYQTLERKVLRLSGSTATPREAARYEELKKIFEKRDAVAGDALAAKMSAARAKLGGKPNNIFSAMAAFKKENE